MAGGIEKRLLKSAIKMAVTWDTEVDVNEALAGITPDNQGAIKMNYPPIEVDEIVGANETDRDRANINPSDFSLDFNKFNFDGKECQLLAMAMGADAVEPLSVIVTGANDKIDFNDGTLCAGTIAAGSYTGAALATAVAAAMNGAAGKTLTFTGAFSTSTGKFTIAHTLNTPNFTILWATGTNTAISAKTILGFSADSTGGFTYTSATAAPSSGAWKHTLTMADTIDGIFASYATEKGTKIHVVPSFKPIKFAFSVNAGMIKLSVNNRGTKVTDASSIVTSLAAVTYQSIHNSTRAKYGQAVFKLNAQTGIALAAGDIIKPKSFTLELERKMDTEHGPGSFTCMEPRQNGKTAVKLTQEFAHLDAVNELLYADWIADAEKKENITVTGPVIVGTHAYSLSFDMPRLQIDDVEIPDAAILPCKTVMRPVQADTAPTGMTALVKPLTITIVNARATSFLV